MSQSAVIDFRRGGLEPPSNASTAETKKIPSGQRRYRAVPARGLNWHQRTFWRLKNDSQYLRSVMQASFALLCVWIGIEFYLFVQWGEKGGTALPASRPPGVEGFLPIGSLISLRYWTETGIINTIHPSGLIILIAILAIGLLLKKAFCSWLCPIGTLSEALWLFGQRLFGKTLTVNKWIDYPLRSLKYLLLLFFAYSILQMDVLSMRAFIESPYNRMADVKMYLFFAEISSTALWIVLALAFLSMIVKNFWCRYLCPYGALLGSVSILSPLKITRQKSTCIDCELCTKECPSAISVHKATRIWSDECTSCMKCVEVCPVKNTLDIRMMQSNRHVPSWAFGVLVAGVFLAITGLGMLTGNWKNSIGNEEYRERFQQLHSGAYEHPFGAESIHGSNN